MATFLHEFHNIIPIHWNNNLFPGWSFGSHLDVRFEFRSIFDDLLDLINFASTKRRESVLYFDDFFCVVRRLRSDLPLVLLMGACFRFLKNLEIWLTSLDDFTRIGGGSFLILTGTNLYLLPLLLLTTGFTLGVNFDATFYLKVAELLSA